MQTKAVVEFAVFTLRTWYHYLGRKRDEIILVFCLGMKWGEHSSKRKIRIFSSVNYEPILLCLCHQSEIILLTAAEDQTNLFSNLGANNFLIDNAPLCVRGKPNSGYF